MNGQFLPCWFQGLEDALAALDDRSIDILMTHCGQACSESYTKQVYQTAYAGAASLDEFIAKLNDIFPEMQMRRDGTDTIEVIYTHCACDLVRSGYMKSPKLCLCAQKSLQYNWEAVLGQGAVTAKLEQSILRGDGYCRLRLLLGRTEH